MCSGTSLGKRLRRRRWRRQNIARTCERPTCDWHRLTLRGRSQAANFSRSLRWPRRKPMSWLSWILAYLFDCLHPDTTFIVWTPYCTYMRRGGAEWVGYVVSILLLVLPALAQSGSTASGSIRGDVFTKGTNGEPAVLSGVLIVLHGPITKETESDAQGAFAIDRLPPGTYQIEANAPRLYAALAVEVSAGTSSTVPVEMNVAAVTSTTSPQLTRLKAMDCAFSRKVHHA